MGLQMAEITLALPAGNQTTAHTLSTTSLQVGPFGENINDTFELTLLSDVQVYVTKGANPTALAPTAGGSATSGDPIPANTKVRVQLYGGEKLAAVAAGAGTLWVTRWG